jgi:hypothetical protein
MMNQLCFQGMKKAFRDGIIPTITFATHALGSTMFLQERTVAIGGILAASIAMPNQTFIGFRF